MNPIINAVLKTGLIDPAALTEMKRWGLVDQEAATNPEPPQSAVECHELIERALQSEGYVLTRETDLEAIQQYALTHRLGQLHLDNGDGDQADFPVSYGRTPLGEYVIGWRSESIAEMLLNGRTHLMADGKRVYFRDVRELFFGTKKAFMVCIPSDADEAVPTPRLPKGGAT
jgi:hypothetical protein